MDDEVGFQWFKQSFIPQATTRNKSRKPILLIYNGHQSHTRLEWIDLVCMNNIHLYCLPPHTTHCLQPLDIGCSRPLQRAWFNHCDEILAVTGSPMELKDAVEEYMVAQ